jgi:4-hydroxybenzoate polyprenyltransferase
MCALLGPTRAREWWAHKVAPILGTGYATAFFAGVPLVDAATALLLVLLALVPGAVYVSLLNDLTDRDADRLAGKPDRFAGRSPRGWRAALAVTVVVGTAIAVAAWRDEPVPLALYAGAWVAFALYSVRPIRLKGRGAAGAVADAAGAHLCPHLLVAAVVLASDGRALDGPWAIAIGTWALTTGLRGALWHQLSDVAEDARAGVRTFARTNPERARWLGARVVFPVELVAFGAVLVQAGSPLAIALLPVYVLLEALRVRRWRISIVVVAPAPAYRIAMHDFYVAFYPLAFLVAAALRHPPDALILMAHLAVFPHTPARIVADVYRELRNSRPWAPAH